VAAGYTAEETMEWAMPKFKLRAVLARKRELELAAEQSLAVWDGEKYLRMLDEINRELDDLTF
jgi:hypothetical protein